MPYISINQKYSDSECIKLSKSYGQTSNSSEFNDSNGACYGLLNSTILIFWAAPNQGMLFKIITNPNKRHYVDGKDIFTFTAYNKNGSYILSTLVQQKYSNLLTDEQLKNYCSSQNSRPYGGVSRSHYCTELILRNNWKIPKDYPIRF